MIIFCGLKSPSDDVQQSPRNVCYSAILPTENPVVLYGTQQCHRGSQPQHQIVSTLGSIRQCRTCRNRSIDARVIYYTYLFGSNLVMS